MNKAVDKSSFLRKNALKLEKNLQLYTFGCKVNQVESEAILKDLSIYDSAKIVIINTCTVTEHADAKCRQKINTLIKNLPNHTIVITGCYVERAYDELKKRYTNAVIVRNKDKNKIARILGLVKKTTSQTCKKNQGTRTRAFLKIQDGCDAFCSYCIVPFVRPNLWNKPFEDVCAEIEHFEQQGFREIVLTGVRIGKYTGMHDRQTLHFPQALEKICKIVADGKTHGIRRIRISSIEPTEISDSLIAILAKNVYALDGTSGIICPHLHIAIQSGDDAILRHMHRQYNTTQLAEIIQKLKQHIPDLTITADIIVGFPGETDSMFQNTIHFLKSLKINGMHIFPFSSRKGTVASAMPGHVQSMVIEKRKNVLKKLDETLRFAHVEKYRGNIVEVLVEKKHLDGYAMGLTPNYIKVRIPYQKGIENRLIKTEIRDVSSTACEGKIL